MNTGQKTAVSLLVSVALFAGFVFSVYSTLFNRIETRFYEPERIAVERRHLKQAADFCNEYIQNLLKKTEEYASNDAVLSYLSQTPSDSEVTERVRLSGELFVNIPALDGYRLLDKNGRNLHYSSYSPDIVKQNGTTKVYKNYPDIEKVQGECSFSLVSFSEFETSLVSKITFNGEKKQLNISVPVYDKFKIFRGTFVFYLKTIDLERELVKNGYLSIGNNLSLFVSDDGAKGGFVTGIPNIGSELFEKPLLDTWTSSAVGPDKMVSGEGDKSWIALSDYSSAYFAFAELYTSDYFELPETARILILVCVFITLFLIIFLLFSFKIDDMVVIRSRIKKIQFAFIAEYLDNKESVDWNQVSRQIEGRKDDLFRDVKKSLGRKGKKHENQVDALLNKSWDEILSAIGARQAFENQITQKDNSAEIKKMLEEVLSKSELKVRAIPAPVQTEVQELPEVEELSEVEELEDAEPVEEVEELSEVEELEDVEPVEEAEELSEVEELEAAEPVDEPEEFTEVEELENAEPVDEPEELTEVEELENAEPVDEVEELTEVEELEDAEPVEEAEELSEVEELEDVEPADEPEELTEVEELKDAKPVEEAEELSEVEELEAAEPVDEPEELTEVEPVEEVKPADEVEELEDVESVEELLEDEPVSASASFVSPDTKKDDSPFEVVELLDVPEAEPVEEIPVEDYEPKLIGRGSVFDGVNSTFEISEEDSFATVENVFAEELRFGEGYIEDINVSHDSVLEEAVTFNLFDPEFGENEELIPVEENKPFSMTGFGLNNDNISDLESGNETIVETDGVFSISENAEVPFSGLDKEFKKLVDAVLR